MKILFVLEFYAPHVGGVETLFTSLAENLARKGHHITVLTQQHDSALPTFEQNDRITIGRYKVSNRYLFTLVALLPALRWARSHDLIQTTSYNAALPAWIAGKIRGKPVVITFHEVWNKLWLQLPYFAKWKGHLHRLFEKLLLRLSFTRFVAVSQFTSQQLATSGIGLENIQTILNGVDYQEFSDFSNRTNASFPFTFTYFGRLGISKGWHLVIPAFAEVSKEHPNSRLKLIIPPDDDAHLAIVHSQIKHYGIESQIKLLHDLTRRNLLGEIQRSSAILIPSYSEGFCFAAVESMALEVPIITSQQGALSEVVGGKYIKIESLTVEDLVSAMRLALDGHWSFALPRRYPLDESVDGYIKLYHEILSTS